MSFSLLNINNPDQLPDTIPISKYTRLSKFELISKYPQARDSFSTSTPILSIEEGVVNDDKEKSQTWSEAYRFAGYYWDNPNIKQRNSFLRDIKFNFDNILSQTENPNELPDLRNRTSLLLWVCKQHNSYLNKIGSRNRVECDSRVLQAFYGPKNETAKRFIGAQDFFIV